LLEGLGESKNAFNQSYPSIEICSEAPKCVAEWTPFQTHSFSERLVAPEIELGHLDL
jgi:hypothetical protein